MRAPSLLMLTAAACAVAVVANAEQLAAQAGGQDRTRLGTSIEQDLAGRDAAAAKRKRALDLREATTKAAEARLAAELEARRKAEEAGRAGGGTQPGEEQYDDLARIYQAMKPARAAVVFEQLDMDVQMKVAQRMRERSTAMILAAMTPKAAAALSMALARRQPPPGRGAAPRR